MATIGQSALTLTKEPRGNDQTVRSDAQKEDTWQRSDGQIRRAERCHVVEIGRPDPTRLTEPRGIDRMIRSYNPRSHVAKIGRPNPTCKMKPRGIYLTVKNMPRDADLMVRSYGHKEAIWHKYNSQIRRSLRAQICGLDSATCQEWNSPVG